MQADRYNIQNQVEHLQMKYIGSGHADLTKWEWGTNIQRDTLASNIGHKSRLLYLATAQNETMARVKFNFLNAMICPCGPPPEKDKDEFHEGIFGKGLDPLLEQPCTLHLMKCKKLQEQQQDEYYVMQVYSSLQTDIFYRKLDQLAKSFYQFSSPYQLPIHHLSYKKNEETKLYDLYVMYEFSNLDSEGKSLQEILLQQPFPIFNEEQLWELAQILIDQIFMGGRLSYEYLDINPWNIYYKNGKPIISNFGLQQHQKFYKKLFCYSDRFFQKNQLVGNQSERQIEMYMRSYMFALGMLLLYIGGKEDPNQMYTDTNQIRLDLLSKRLESFKKGYSEQLSLFITKCLQIKEEKRLDIEEIIQENGSQLLNREIFYYQGKLQGNEFYSGFMKTNQIKMGIGEFLTETKEIYKGTFTEGKKNGYGIYFDNNSKFIAGEWQQENLTSGLAIKKNKCIYYGQLSNQMPSGKGTLIALEINDKAKFYVFEGQFDTNGKPQSGKCLLRDAQIVDEIPEIDFEWNEQNQVSQVLEQKPKILNQ